MRTSQLTKYVKSRMTNCIYCGKPITENQDFKYCSARTGRYVAYVFIHCDCIPAAQKYIISKNNQGSPYGSVKNYDEEVEV